MKRFGSAAWNSSLREGKATVSTESRAIETLTIARMNMSSPLRGIGLRQRQTATTTKREIGKRAMKTLLAGVAFAIAGAFSSQASAFPYCTKITWHGNYYVCTIDAE
jgi:hypothetical protein